MYRQDTEGCGRGFFGDIGRMNMEESVADILPGCHQEGRSPIRYLGITVLRTPYGKKYS